MAPSLRLDSAQLDALTRINLDDIFAAFGLAPTTAARSVLSALFWPAARGFARQVATYDALVGEHGLPHGAEWILRHFLRELQVAGQAAVPAQGPLLVLANHPGMVDTVALFVGLGRPDLRVVALERPFLKALSHTSRQLIYVPEAAEQRVGVVRRVAAALRAGQAVLTFPAGEIEPDPAVLPGAAAALENWSESLSLFVRLAPEAQIVVAMVSGVLSAGAQRNPLTRLRRTQAGRERLAAMLQIMVPAYRAVVTRVAFSRPMPGRAFLDAHREPADQKRAIVAEARRLIEQPPAEWQTVARGRR